MPTWMRFLALWICGPLFAATVASAQRPESPPQEADGPDRYVDRWLRPTVEADRWAAQLALAVAPAPVGGRSGWLGFELDRPNGLAIRSGATFFASAAGDGRVGAHLSAGARLTDRFVLGGAVLAVRAPEFDVSEESSPRGAGAGLLLEAGRPRAARLSTVVGLMGVGPLRDSRNSTVVGHVAIDLQLPVAMIRDARMFARWRLRATFFSSFVFVNDFSLELLLRRHYRLAVGIRLDEYEEPAALLGFGVSG